MQEEGIQLKVTAGDSHWQLGRVEAHGSVIKEMLSRIDKEVPVKDAVDFRRALIQACNAKNTLARVHGYTPAQAVLGVSRRLPASITADESAISHALGDAETLEADRFRHSLELRTTARKAFIETDNSSSLRRALLRRSRPVRHNFEAGDMVLYWRRKGGNLRRERGSWFGPARVLLVEGPKIVWLTHASKLIRASPEQLRAASLREWKAVRHLEEFQVPVSEWSKRIDHQDFLQLGDELPDIPEEEAEWSRANSTLESVQEPEREISNEDRHEYERAESFEYSPEGRDGVDVPVPEDGDEDLLFGDTVDFSWESHKVWEIDITLPTCFDIPERRQMNLR